jgi:hypothetical protein
VPVHVTLSLDERRKAMQITLDAEQWEAGAPLTMGDVLAEVNERAEARGHLVTSVRLDQRRLTDRDLDAALLSQPVSRFATLEAASHALEDVVRQARGSALRYADVLRAEADALLAPLRFGTSPMAPLDAWLGKLADFLELMEGPAQPAGSGSTPCLSPWVHELLQARTEGDRVRMADVLEYEILPRLGSKP